MKFFRQFISISFLWVAALFILIHPVLPHSLHFGAGSGHDLRRSIQYTDFSLESSCFDLGFSENQCHTHNSSEHKEGCAECSFNADFISKFTVIQYFVFISDNSGLLPDIFQQKLISEYFKLNFFNTGSYYSLLSSRAPPSRA
jgi:hypothetical protein